MLFVHAGKRAASSCSFGRNVYTKKPPKSFWALVWEQLEDLMLRLLIVAAIVSLVLGLSFEIEKGEYIDGIAITVTVLFVAMVGAWNDYRKEQEFRKLSDVEDDKEIKVIRNGQQTQVSIFELVVGDVVALDVGDQVPCDGIFVSGFDLKVDESAMTGESDEVKKTAEKDPFFISGCHIVAGVGTMMVTAVGDHSVWGQALAKLSRDRENTPLQDKLDGLAKNIGKLGILLASLTFLVQLVSFLVRLAIDQRAWEWSMMTEVTRFVVNAIIIIVVAVPEGLPLAVTLSLAYAMRKMVLDQNLVRHLDACETMGGATNICSDKTGTLTQNRMTVVQMWFDGTHYKNESEVRNDVPAAPMKEIIESVSLNSKAYVSKDENDQLKLVGSKTECALLLLAGDVGLSYDDIREQIPVVKVFAFSSEKKQMSVVVRRPDSSVLRVHTKGASEIVSTECRSYLNTDGEHVPITDDVRDSINKHIHAMACNGLRTLAIATYDTDIALAEMEDADTPPGSGERTLLCIVGIKDPVRPEVPRAVADCQRAGIRVRMVTGDNIDTARHIARECGILSKDGIAMEGREFRNLSDGERDAILPRLDVLARSQPNDKFILVNRLRTLGEVVGVTGDGTNDAPALSEADIGLAMGISGTEVAKEASDVIIRDDNFASIVKAVMWGRNVYDAIRKFIQFQLTVNVVAVTTNFVSVASQKHPPLQAVQLLWVNIIMDSLGALALATDPPTPELLRRKPHGRHEALISKTMWRNILGQALYQLVVMFVLLYAGESILGVKGPVDHEANERDTLIFNAFVWCQLFNEINSRKLKGLNCFENFFTNRLFLGVLIFSSALQVLMVETFQVFSKTVSLSPTLWGISIGIGALSLPIGLVIRLIPVEPEEEEASDLTHTSHEPLRTVASQTLSWDVLKEAILSAAK